jgi:hypothetical protein
MLAGMGVPPATGKDIVGVAVGVKDGVNVEVEVAVAVFVGEGVTVGIGGGVAVWQAVKSNMIKAGNTIFFITPPIVDFPNLVQLESVCTGRGYLMDLVFVGILKVVSGYVYFHYASEKE